MSPAWSPQPAWRQPPAHCCAPWRALMLAALLGSAAAAAPPRPATEGAKATASAPAAGASRKARAVQPAQRAQREQAEQREQQKAAAFASRQQSARAHREAVLARIRQQDAQRPPARHLPLPLPPVKDAPAAASSQDLPARP